MIPEHVLRKLYCDDLMTDAEIARLYGTYQVKVSRLRQKYGIPTITKAQRMQARLPALSPRQRELLVGSLLGDGHMKDSSRASARFIERHGASQAPYLRWKEEQLRPFVSCTYQVVKRLPDGREFHGVELSTKSCPQFRELFDLFYSGGKKVFPASLPDLMTPLVLAVWYMDDGSLFANYHPRIHFGLDPSSLERAVDALSKLGLTPNCLGVGGNQVLSFPGQDRAFFDLVAPHIPECMSYKVPGQDSPRRIVDLQASRADPAEVGVLYQQGLSMDALAQRFGVSRSTIRRRLAVAGVDARPPGRPKVGYTVESATVLLERLDRSQDAETLCAQALEILKRTPFPFPEPLSREEALKELGRVKRSTAGIEKWSPVGLRLCSSLFPNRYKATYKSRVSAWDGWHDEKHLLRAIRFQVRVGDPLVPRRVLRALTANCRTPTIFRPVVARYLYERYCPVGGTVWDPCAGYGGRLLGALAAGVRYVASEVEPETVQGNLRLAELLGMLDRVDVREARAEDFDPGVVDMVFTSPPYYRAELYGRSAGQSVLRHQAFDDWIGGFLRPVVQRSWDCLPGGGVLVLNVADVKIGRRQYPIVDRAISEAVAVGFGHEETLQMPLARLNRGRRATEPLLVFRRK